jgi:hypothetical protein
MQFIEGIFLMQARQRPPSTMGLVTLGIVALLALSGAGVLGYTVISSHWPWVTPAASPTPAPIATPKLSQTAAPEQTYITLCSPQGTPDAFAVTATWQKAVSFDTDVPTQYLMSAHGRQTALRVPGTFIRLYLHLTIAYPNDGLSCLRVFAHWPGMPVTIDASVYGYDFTGDVLPTVPLIQNPSSLEILINMNSSLYTPRPSIRRTPLPKEVPITLTFQVSTVKGRLYTSQANESYTFIRV